jgi:predicted membrane-bound spermidine synthase
LLAVALIAASTLSYEILLVRIFAIEYFHHFAYMAIGVAMLGFGASGTLLALLGKPNRSVAEAGFTWSVVLTSVSLVASPTLVHQVSLDPTQLAWDSGQWIRLALVYCLLALPFAVGAIGILLALVLNSAHPGTTYGASFAGSGLGALLALAVLWFVSPARTLAAPALIAALAGLVLAHGTGRAVNARLAAWFTLAVASFVCIVPLWKLDVSPYKALRQVEAYPDARRIAESPSPVGWVVAVNAPTFRYAPGLSLAYTGSFPQQTALFVDGQIAGASIAPEEYTASDSVLDWLPTALPYSIREPHHVLVIGAGGGTEVRNAISHGAHRITAVELHPEFVRRGRDVSQRSPESNTEVEWVLADARSYLAGTRERFDLISLAPAGGFGTSAAGIFSLSEDFLHTVDAYEAYMERLTDGGLLAITRWLTIPPRENVRVVLTVAKALRRVAAQHVSDGLVVVRSWGTATVIAKPAGFVAADLDSLRYWAHSRQFDIDWESGLTEPISIYNHLEEPTLFRAAATAAQHPDSLNRFLAAYPFAVAPVSDARPYPHHFLRFQSLGRLLGEDQGSWLPFAEWGPIALVATLVQSAVLAVLLLVVPVVTFGRLRSGNPTGSHLAYFLAIGFAYMAAEIAAIQQLGLLLGHPVFAVVVVLATFLICSGIGSAWSDRLSPTRVWIVNAGLLLILILYGIVLLAAVHLLQPAAIAVRAVSAALIVCPLAFLMGIPFPHGLRLLGSDSHAQVAWAWAANGVASVVAAPLAALIALERGSPELFLFAALAYGVAGVLAKGETAERSRSFT